MPSHPIRVPLAPTPVARECAVALSAWQTLLLARVPRVPPLSHT